MGNSLDRVDIWIKTGIGTLAGIVSIVTGLFGIVFSILLLLMLLDFISGIMAAAYTTGLKSSIGTKGFIKKLYIILLIGAIYAIEIGVLGTKGVVTDGIAASYCVIEMVSILENGHKLNVPIHQKLMKFIEIMRNKVGESESNDK